MFVLCTAAGMVVKRGVRGEDDARQLMSGHPAWVPVALPADVVILGRVVWTARTLVLGVAEDLEGHSRESRLDIAESVPIASACGALSFYARARHPVHDPTKQARLALHVDTPCRAQSSYQLAKARAMRGPALSGVCCDRIADKRFHRAQREHEDFIRKMS